MSRPGGVSVALFDSSTLVGKGVKSHLHRRKFPVGRIQLFDTGAVEEGGNLSEFAGEAHLAVRPVPDEMDGTDLAFFCGPVGSAAPYLEWPRKEGFVAVDLTLSANRRGDVPVVNVSVNAEAIARHEGLLAVPHPVSQILSTLLSPLARELGLEEVVSFVLQPASEAGEPGIEELYRQTVGVLNFGEVPQEQFGKVLAFNLIPHSVARPAGATEEEITREIGRILGRAAFPHAMRILLAPVFHCHSFLCRIRFTRPADPAAIRKALSVDPSIRVAEKAGEATPAERAGEERIVVGEIQPDPTGRACWIWGIADNLATGVALDAVRIAEALLQAGRLGEGKPA
jgi:aspartate-semialdehyde dehydrogenase